MVVLGIDPGSHRCGYAAVARVGGRLQALESGVLEPGAAPLAERLAVLLRGLQGVIARTGAAAVSVETAFCGASARSALVLGHARGVALAVAAQAGLPVFEYAPATVKRAFTGNGRAGKPQMVRTARQLLGVAARRADEADAVAIAVCHLAHARGVPARSSRSGPPVSATSRAIAPARRARPAAPAPRSAEARAAEARARLRPAVRRYGARA